MMGRPHILINYGLLDSALHGIGGLVALVQYPGRRYLRT
jgi:hypothetical protein